MEAQCYVIFSNEGPGGLALRIPIIMQKIASYLDARDLCQWYNSSKIFRRIIEEMDDSCWRKKTQTLAKACTMNTQLEEHMKHYSTCTITNQLDDDFPKAKACKITIQLEEHMKKNPEKSFREIFPILKTEVENLVSRIRGPEPENQNLNWFGHGRSGNHKLCITLAASLAYYGQFGSVESMTLGSMNLSHIPIEQLCSLASSVTVHFGLHDFSGCDLSRIIDSVKCEWLSILEQSIDKGVTEAVVRAMESRIERVQLEYGMICDEEMILDTEALTQYSGRGQCRSIEVFSNEDEDEKRRPKKNRQWLKTWAVARGWTVTKDDSLILRVERINREES